MKTKSVLLLTAALLGGLLSASAALTNTAACHEVLAHQKIEAPVPTKIVLPTDLPRSFMGATVKVTFTVDESGRTHNIKVISSNDRRLTKSLVTALSQWEFTPASKDGTPVSAKVELPLELLGS